MQKAALLLSTLIFISCFTTEKKNVVEKKFFKDDNTYVIVCKGWPKEGLIGKAKTETAKEAALLNAQITAKESFNPPIDVVRNGTIEKYVIHDDNVTIYYVIKYNGLKSLIK